jgi:hypothetical protein
VRPGTWAVVLLLLLGAVLCASVIPRTDSPETSYNEIDTPVNQAPPVVPALRLVRPAVAPVILPKNFGNAASVNSSPIRRNIAGVPAPRDPHSIQNLFCTLLI